MSIESPTLSEKANTKLAKTTDGLADRAESRISDLAHRAEKAARKAETVLHDGVETLRARSRDYADQAAERFESAQKAVTDKVREKPLTGLAIAAGAGLVIGMILARRR